MMLSCLGTLERIMRDLNEEVEALMTSKGVQQKPEARSNKISSLPRPPGPVYLKLVTQDASGLCFRRSTYGWKPNLIRKLIQVVSHQKLFGINRNNQNKSASRICQGAATPSFGPLDRVSCLGPLGGTSRGVMPKTLSIAAVTLLRVWVLFSS